MQTNAEWRENREKQEARNQKQNNNKATTYRLQ
jgi:hypothetical protein